MFQMSQTMIRHKGLAGGKRASIASLWGITGSELLFSSSYAPCSYPQTALPPGDHVAHPHLTHYFLTCGASSACWIASCHLQTHCHHCHCQMHPYGDAAVCGGGVASFLHLQTHPHHPTSHHSCGGSFASPCPSYSSCAFSCRSHCRFYPHLIYHASLIYCSSSSCPCLVGLPPLHPHCHSSCSLCALIFACCCCSYGGLFYCLPPWTSFPHSWHAPAQQLSSPARGRCPNQRNRCPPLPPPHRNPHHRPRRQRPSS
uniref:Uncharacterized protein n=1 Tax=Arundo donax TaxID=35708 RepID=A0A0A9CGH6_ARUDO